MATRILGGPRFWSMTRDRDGHREYKIRWLVKSDSSLVGPADVLTTPGLAVPGDYWIVDADTDLWATCKLDADVHPHPQYQEGEPVLLWIVEQTFSTKGDDKRCKDQQWDDPLLVPDRVSGGFSKYTEEASYDRFGNPIMNSAFEPFRGQQVEFDANRHQIKVTQNRAALEIELFGPMVDTLNSAPLWGLPPRTIKLSNATWERKFYGQCYIYYERTFEFDVRYNPGSASDFLGFDRLLLDKATKVLNGHWGTMGSGCQLNLTLDASGGIEAALISVGGTGYQPSNNIQLYVTGGGGGGGLVLVTTDATGVAVAGSLVLNKGSGYTSATNITTTVDTGWILDDVASNVPPDPNNPKHFIQFKDRNGEDAPVILDGHGKPAQVEKKGNVVLATNTMPIKITTDRTHLLETGDAITIRGVQGNTAANGTWVVTVNDGTHFELNGSTGNGLFLGGFSGTINDASETAPIAIGTTVPHGLSDGDVVTITGVSGNTAANETWEITVVDDTHFELDGSVGNFAYAGGGVWVQVGGTWSGAAGMFLVQKYNEADFTLLGIPLTF